MPREWIALGNAAKDARLVLCHEILRMRSHGRSCIAVAYPEVMRTLWLRLSLATRDCSATGGLFLAPPRFLDDNPVMLATVVARGSQCHGPASSSRSTFGVPFLRKPRSNEGFRSENPRRIICVQSETWLGAWQRLELALLSRSGRLRCSCIDKPAEA